MSVDIPPVSMLLKRAVPASAVHDAAILGRWWPMSSDPTCPPHDGSDVDDVPALESPAVEHLHCALHVAVSFGTHVDIIEWVREADPVAPDAAVWTQSGRVERIHSSTRVLRLAAVGPGRQQLLLVDDTQSWTALQRRPANGASPVSTPTSMASPGAFPGSVSPPPPQLVCSEGSTLAPVNVVARGVFSDCQPGKSRPLRSVASPAAASLTLTPVGIPAVGVRPDGTEAAVQAFENFLTVLTFGMSGSAPHVEHMRLAAPGTTPDPAAAQLCFLDESLRSMVSRPHHCRQRAPVHRFTVRPNSVETLGYSGKADTTCIVPISQGKYVVFGAGSGPDPRPMCAVFPGAAASSERLPTDAAPIVAAARVAGDAVLALDRKGGLWNVDASCVGDCEAILPAGAVEPLRELRSFLYSPEAACAVIAESDRVCVVPVSNPQPSAAAPVSPRALQLTTPSTQEYFGRATAITECFAPATGFAIGSAFGGVKVCSTTAAFDDLAVLPGMEGLQRVAFLPTPQVRSAAALAALPEAIPEYSAVPTAATSTAASSDAVDGCADLGGWAVFSSFAGTTVLRVTDAVEEAPLPGLTCDEPTVACSWAILPIVGDSVVQVTATAVRAFDPTTGEVHGVWSAPKPLQHASVHDSGYVLVTSSDATVAAVLSFDGTSWAVRKASTLAAAVSAVGFADAAVTPVQAAEGPRLPVGLVSTWQPAGILALDLTTGVPIGQALEWPDGDAGLPNSFVTLPGRGTVVVTTAGAVCDVSCTAAGVVAAPVVVSLGEPVVVVPTPALPGATSACFVAFGHRAVHVSLSGEAPRVTGLAAPHDRRVVSAALGLMGASPVIFTAAADELAVCSLPRLHTLRVSAVEATVAPGRCVRGLAHCGSAILVLLAPPTDINGDAARFSVEAFDQRSLRPTGDAPVLLPSGVEGVCLAAVGRNTAAVGCVARGSKQSGLVLAVRVGPLRTEASLTLPNGVLDLNANAKDVLFAACGSTVEALTLRGASWSRVATHSFNYGAAVTVKALPFNTVLVGTVQTNLRALRLSLCTRTQDYKLTEVCSDPAPQNATVISAVPGCAFVIRVDDNCNTYAVCIHNALAPPSEAPTPPPDTPQLPPTTVPLSSPSRESHLPVAATHFGAAMRLSSQPIAATFAHWGPVLLGPDPAPELRLSSFEPAPPSQRDGVAGKAPTLGALPSRRDEERLQALFACSDGSVLAFVSLPPRLCDLLAAMELAVAQAAEESEVLLGPAFATARSPVTPLRSSREFGLVDGDVAGLLESLPPKAQRHVVRLVSEQYPALSSVEALLDVLHAVSATSVEA